jgi:calcium-dependent protein kinase
MSSKFSEAEAHHEVSTEVVQSVTHFLKLSKIKKLMLKVVAFTLNPKQIEQLRDDFYSIDSDRNGTISMKELKKALLKANQTAGDIEVSFKALEEAGLADSDINYSEFLAAAMLKRININEERLELAFETLDSEGSGFVDVSALRTSLGTEQSVELLDDLLAELDTNNDGKIDYKEFLAYWKSLERAEKLTPLQRFAMSVKKVKAINGFK